MVGVSALGFIPFGPTGDSLARRWKIGRYADFQNHQEVGCNSKRAKKGWSREISDFISVLISPGSTWAAHRGDRQDGTFMLVRASWRRMPYFGSQPSRLAQDLNWLGLMDLGLVSGE